MRLVAVALARVARFPADARAREAALTTDAAARVTRADHFRVRYLTRCRMILEALRWGQLDGPGGWRWAGERPVHMPAHVRLE